MLRSNLLKRVITNQSGGLLLDTYPAYAAWGLRYLKTSFIGQDVVLIKRTSDNSQQGFTPDELTDGTLSTFLNGSNGKIVTIYDQESGGYDFTVTDNLFIANSGTVHTLNGNPIAMSSIVGSETIDSPTISRNVLDSESSVFTVHESQGVGSIEVLFSEVPITDTDFEGIIQWSTTTSDKRNYFSRIGGTNTTRLDDINTLSQSTHSILETHRSATDVKSYRDNVQQDTDTNLDTFSSGTFFRLLARGGNKNGYSGGWQETIVFGENRESNRSAILSNQNNYYGVY